MTITIPFFDTRKNDSFSRHVQPHGELLHVGVNKWGGNFHKEQFDSYAEYADSDFDSVLRYIS